MPHPAALAPLDAFVGAWRVGGHNLEGAPTGEGEPVTGVESYDWLPGGFFLEYRWHRRFGAHDHEGIGIFACDAPDGPCAAQFYDNLGFARRYAASVDDDVLTLSGPRERATIALGDGGRTLAIRWDRSSDGVEWQPLCALMGTRIRESVA
jgi:hypothetical protein